MNLVGGPADLSLYDSLLRDFKGHKAYLQGPNKQSFISSYSSGNVSNTQWAAFREKWGQAVYYVPDIDDASGFNTSDPGEWNCALINSIQLTIKNRLLGILGRCYRWVYELGDGVARPWFTFDWISRD